MMKITFKEKKKPSMSFTVKHMQKNEGLYYNEDNDIYVLSVAEACDVGNPKNTLIYISGGSIIETLDVDAWKNDTFTLTTNEVTIANQKDENE